MRGQHKKGNKFAVDPKQEWNCVASLLLHDAGIQWTDALGASLRALRDSGMSAEEAVRKVVESIKEKAC